MKISTSIFTILTIYALSAESLECNTAGLCYVRNCCPKISFKKNFLPFLSIFITNNSFPKTREAIGLMVAKHHTTIVWHCVNPIILVVNGFLTVKVQNIVMDLLIAIAFKIITTMSPAKWNVK